MEGKDIFNAICFSYTKAPEVCDIVMKNTTDFLPVKEMEVHGGGRHEGSGVWRVLRFVRAGVCVSVIGIFAFCYFQKRGDNQMRTRMRMQVDEQVAEYMRVNNVDPTTLSMRTQTLDS